MTFILEPLYKLTATVVGEHPKTIERVLGEEFGVYLKSSAYSQDVKPLLKEVRGEGEGRGAGGCGVLVVWGGAVCVERGGGKGAPCRQREGAQAELSGPGTDKGKGA